MASAAQKQDMIVHEYLTSKVIGTSNRDLCPQNTPAAKINTAPGSGMKVLPPIKASSSLERTSQFSTSSSGVQGGGGSNYLGQGSRQTGLDRGNEFKKRDLRGGKRARQT